MRIGELEDIKTVERLGWVSLSVSVISPLILFVWALIVWARTGHFPVSGNPQQRQFATETIGLLISLLTSELSLWLLMAGDLLSGILLLVSGLQLKRIRRDALIFGVANIFYVWVMFDGPIGLNLLHRIGN